MLRKSPLLRLEMEPHGVVMLHNVRPSAKSLALSPEALVDARGAGGSPASADTAHSTGEPPVSRQPVAIVFGPQHGL